MSPALAASAVRTPRPDPPPIPSPPAPVIRSSRASRPSGGVRRWLVQRVRAAIASGDYETGEKLDIALDRLLRDLR